MSRPRGPLGAVAAVAAAVLCVSAALAGCGSGGPDDDGYVAIGAGSPDTSTGDQVPPDDGVVLVPLDGEGEQDGRGAEGKDGSPGPKDSSEKARGGKSAAPSGSPSEDGDYGREGAGGHGGAGTPPPGPSQPSAPSDPSDPPTTPPAPEPDPGPAELTFGTPDREPAEERWCESVTVTFRNIGGSPVTSGTVTFGTHIIGALGIDWATIHSERKLPAPLAPGARKARTWKICVEAWRVPLGMHVETQDVSVEWE